VSSGGRSFVVEDSEDVDVVANLEAADGEDICSAKAVHASTLKPTENHAPYSCFVSFSLTLAPAFQHFQERRITEDSEAKFKDHDRGDVAKNSTHDVAVFVAVTPINRRDVFSLRTTRLRALSACSMDFDS
jgi:hypothetical protein